jgi:hypothetical protein
MTLDDIDNLLDLMAKEAADKGDDAFLPAAISMSTDSYFRLPLGAARCTNIIHGIRYRGVQILVARAREDKVINRAEDDGRGEPYFELEPKAS